MPTPWAGIFAMAKSSSAKQTILVVRIPVNTGFETDEAVVRGVGVLRTVVRRCEMCKNMLFFNYFEAGAFFINISSKLKM